MHWVHRHIIPQAYSSLPFGIERRLLEQLPPNWNKAQAPPRLGLAFSWVGGHTKICSQQRPFGLDSRGVRGGYLLRLEHVLWPEEVAVVRLPASGNRHERVRSGSAYQSQAGRVWAGRARVRCHGVALSRPIASLDPALATGTASESARRRSMQRRASSPVERDRHGEVV